MIGNGLPVAGVDEAGRGPLAGPVYAAAVILSPRVAIPGLRDSKKVPPAKREVLADMIRSRALDWQVAHADVEEIDTMNILQAALLAMRRAVDGLRSRPSLVLIDGVHAPKMDYAVRTVVRGDESEICISAASILAKVARDREMYRLSTIYPGYGFDANKGYGTPAHLTALRTLGPSPVHRRSFSPVRDAMSRGPIRV